MMAEAADPDWIEPTLLRGQIAYRRSWMLWGEWDEADAWVDSGLVHAGNALAIDERSAEALYLRGRLRYWRYLLQVIHDPAEQAELLAMAQQDLEAAVGEDPTLASAYETLSRLYYRPGAGTISDAANAARRAYESDAYLSQARSILNRLFLVHYDLEAPRQAKRWCDEGRRRFPEYIRFVDCQLWVMTMNGIAADVDEAWRLAGEMERLSPESQRALNRRKAVLVVGGVLARAGLADSARSVMLSARTDDRQIDPELQLVSDEVTMRVLVGDHEEAIDLLTRWMAAHPDQDHGVAPGGDVPWRLRLLVDNPRFRLLLRLDG
ncbi:MAG: hypothetical protein IIC73_08525 [Armatimonadetes bacterium]|nr:hypothetical protein [Armatimonadota bacterium]